jgi:hypothetical protein
MKSPCLVSRKGMNHAPKYFDRWMVSIVPIVIDHSYTINKCRHQRRNSKNKSTSLEIIEIEFRAAADQKLQFFWLDERNRLP